MVQGKYLTDYETLCTVADRGSVRSPGGGEVYVCARDGMHVCYISTILASLTLPLAAMSAPFSKSREQMSLWP
jgi:hypothetical protein